MTQYNLEKHVSTEKQKELETDFIKDAEEYEVWDEVEIGKEYDGARTFKIKKEDLKDFAIGAMEDNPLMTDEEAAKESKFGELVEHPMFISAMAFWCIDKGYHGSWVRTPGAMNPGQEIERYERFKVGEEISIKQVPKDKYVVNGLHFCTTRLDFYNQDGRLKARFWGTLILPKDREELMKYKNAEGKKEEENE